MKKIAIFILGTILFTSNAQAQWNPWNPSEDTYNVWKEQQCRIYGNCDTPVFDDTTWGGGDVVVPPSDGSSDQVYTNSEGEQVGNNAVKSSTYRAPKKKWYKEHKNELIVGAAVSAAFVGVMVYIGFEQSDSNPTHVKLLSF